MYARIMKLSKTLVRIREQKGLNVAEAARKIGIGRSLLWSLENEDISPRVSTIKKIADAYGMSVDRLIS